MSNFENLNMRGTRANQPGAGIPGRQYYVTDEQVTERDNGSIWEDISDSGSGPTGTVATDSIWDAKGDLAVGTGADTAAKLTVGANGTRLEAASGETTGIKWSDVGKLLAYKANTAGNYTTGLSSATLADVDATNMAVTFTAPVSGNVLVRLSAACSAGDTNANAYLTWGLREDTTIIAGGVGESIVHRNPNDASAYQVIGASMAFVLTGISAGSHTYKWAYAISTGNAAVIKANSSSPAIMEVWAL